MDNCLVPLSFFLNSCRVLPSILVGMEYQKKIENFLTSYLPNLKTSGVCFECSLLGEQDWGDFHILLDVCHDEFSQFFVGMDIQDPFWKCVTSFFKEKGTQKFLLEIGVKSIFLEFDIGSNPDATLRPNLFFVFDISCVDQLSSISELFFRLKNKKISQELFFSLRRLVENNCMITSIGFMFARSDTIRATILTKSSSIHSINILLEQSKLENVFDLLMKKIDINPDLSGYPLKFGFDFTEQGILSSRVGLYAYNLKNIFYEKSDISVFDEIYKKKLVSRKKQQALLSWTKTDLAPYIDPLSDNLIQMVQEVHHFKFICTSKQDLWVKAYMTSRCFRKNKQKG